MEKLQTGLCQDLDMWGQMAAGAELKQPLILQWSMDCLIVIAFITAVLVGFEMMDYTVVEGEETTICFSQSGALERSITITVTAVDYTALGKMIL